MTKNTNEGDGHTPIQSPLAFAFPSSQPRHDPLWERLHASSPSHQHSRHPLVCITPKQRGYTGWRQWGRYQQLIKIKQHAGCWCLPARHQPASLLMILGRLSFYCLFGCCHDLDVRVWVWQGQAMNIPAPSSMVRSGGQTGMAGLGHGETLNMHTSCTGCAATGVAGGVGILGEMEMATRKREREDQVCYVVVEDLAPEIHLQQVEMDQLIATHVIISSPLSIFSFHVIIFCFLFH